MTDDPMDEVAEAMRTTVGSQELALRMKLGNDGFEEWKRMTAVVENAQLLGVIHESRFKERNADLVLDQSKYLAAKATFWASVSFAVVLLALCGVGLAVWAVA